MSKIRAGILGCGGMAGAHAWRFKENPNVEIVALCDVDEPRLQKFIAQHLPDYQPVPKTFVDAARMYKESQLDAVAIVTPHTQHFDQAKQALKAGCHVLMEKPMVTDSGQAHALAKIIKKAGKVFTIGYNTPCTPEFRYLRKLIRSKELGKLELVSGWLAQDWRRLTIGTWRQDPALSGGGQMYDSGAHIFNSLVWTVEQSIKEVQAFVDNVGTRVDINGTANILFSKGTFATITVSGNCPNGGAGMCYMFDNGRVEIDPWGGSWIKIFKRDGGEVKYPPIPGKVESPNDNFINAILGKDEPMTSVVNGINQSELMDAIYESARTGKVAKPKAR